MEVNKKPTLIQFQPPSGNVAEPSGTILSNGFLDGVDKIHGRNYNAFWLQDRKVAEYLFQGVHSLYLNRDTGNDANEGSLASPLKTIDKAVEYIAPNALTVIYLADSLNEYLVGESGSDLILSNHKVIIIGGAGTKIRHVAKTINFLGSFYTSYYKFILQGDSSLTISCGEINLSDTVGGFPFFDLLENKNFACNYLIGDTFNSNSNLRIFANSINFSSDGDPSFPALIFNRNKQISNITLGVQVTTNNKGYLIQFPSDCPLTFINQYQLIIDNPEFIFKNARNDFEILDTGTFSAFSTQWRFSDGINHSVILDADEGTGNVLTAFNDFYAQMTGKTISSSMDIHRNGANQIYRLKIRLEGSDYRETTFPLKVDLGGLLVPRYVSRTQQPKRFANVVSNKEFPI